MTIKEVKQSDMDSMRFEFDYYNTTKERCLEIIETARCKGYEEFYYELVNDFNCNGGNLVANFIKGN